MRIKIERFGLLLLLLALFSGCFYIMNLSYDTFARYNFELKEEEKDYLRKHLDSSEIELIITNQINPEVLFLFIYSENFDIANILWYQEALDKQEGNIEYIISFINTYRSLDKLNNIQDVTSYLSNYSYATLEEFFDSTSPYLADSVLIRNPKSPTLALFEPYSVYDYVPETLVEVTNIKTNPLYGTTIKIQKDALPSLQNMCIELTKLFESECGGLELTIGYLSFDEQKNIFPIYMLDYGKDEFSKHWDYPSQSEYQLGYSLRFEFAPTDIELDLDESDKKKEDHSEKEKKEEVTKWIKEHAHEYGYILRYPENKQSQTGKLGQELTLRYVGTEIAKDIYTKGITLNDYK